MGFDVGAYGIKPSLSKIRVIAEWPTSECVRDVCSFVGLANFYRKFICWFSEIANPLMDLTKRNRQFVWGPKEEEAFERLKTALVFARVCNCLTSNGNSP